MNKNTILYIDTSNSQETVVAVIRTGKRQEYREQTDVHKSQNVLPLIEKALGVEKITFEDLTAIEVNPGPGSFTGVRVGVTVANALGFLLKIPVNEKESAEPIYESSKFD